MTTKKKQKQKESNKKNSVEHVIHFDHPKSNDVGKSDRRLEELIAQSHLSVILSSKKN